MNIVKIYTGKDQKSHFEEIGLRCYGKKRIRILLGSSASDRINFQGFFARRILQLA